MSSLPLRMDTLAPPPFAIAPLSLPVNCPKALSYVDGFSSSSSLSSLHQFPFLSTLLAFYVNLFSLQPEWVTTISMS